MARRERCFCGQDLVGEVEWHACQAAVVVLSDTLREPLSELRVLVQQLLEQRDRQPQQGAVVDGRDRRRTWFAEKERALAEEVALAEKLKVVLPAVLRPVGPQPALIDDVHRPGRLTLEHDDLSGRDVHRFEPRQELAERGCRQRGEARMDLQEIPERTFARDCLQCVGDLRMRAGEPGEDRAAQAQHGHRAARTHGCEPRGSFEQSALAEAVAAVEHVEGDLLTVLAALDHSGRAGDDDVKGICLVALAHDGGAERVTLLLEALSDERARETR